LDLKKRQFAAEEFENFHQRNWLHIANCLFFTQQCAGGAKIESIVCRALCPKREFNFVGIGRVGFWKSWGEIFGKKRELRVVEIFEKIAQKCLSICFFG
jgi:hypothetical protein